MFGIGIIEVIILLIGGLVCIGLPIGIVLALMLKKPRDE